MDTIRRMRKFSSISLIDDAQRIHVDLKNWIIFYDGKNYDYILMVIKTFEDILMTIKKNIRRWSNFRIYFPNSNAHIGEIALKHPENMACIYMIQEDV